MSLLYVGAYLTGCLDAQDGHPGLRVALELMDQLDPLRGRDTAIDTDITSLEQQRRDNTVFPFGGFTVV